MLNSHIIIIEPHGPWKKYTLNCGHYVKTFGKYSLLEKVTCHICEHEAYMKSLRDTNAILELCV